MKTLPDYINPNNHTVYLTGPDGLSVAIPPSARIGLPDFFERYCVKGFIRRVAGNSTHAVASQPQAPKAQPSPHRRITTQPVQQPPTHQPIHHLPDPIVAARSLRAQPLPEAVKQPSRPIQGRIAAGQPPERKLVGKQLREDPHPLLQEAISAVYCPISNNIGVGILSFNRPQALKRLVESIRKYTDLRRTTVFISDDGSTDGELCQYLDNLERHHDFIILRGDRLGVAGNSNRLLRCLARFQHGLLLNDDVEITARGWDTFYPEAAAQAGLHHFCMRQPGIYGAKPGEGTQRNGVHLTAVADKPHGAVLYFDQVVLEKVGYFDEATFGLYGMEHVDWSERCQQANGIPGYFDVAGSDGHFVIHGDPSAVPGRQDALAQGRIAYSARPQGRGHVAPGPRSVVPKVSVVIPCRNQGRSSCIETVVAGIRAQRFPDIEIILAEHDVISHIQPSAQPFKHALVMTAGAGPFNKARVFNAGVAKATANYLILHDADMLVQADYTAAVVRALQGGEACHLGRTVIYLTEHATAQVQQVGMLDANCGCERVVGYFEGGSLGCRRQTYWRVGGFNQDFVGYGVEDCEFYARLANGARSWCEERTFTFIHLWHGRVPGWEVHHERNKDLGHKLEAQPIEQRLAEQCERLRRDGYGGQVEAALIA